MLEIKNLNISIHDRFLVKNLNFSLNSGDKLAIIGEEGNGKSTLLKCILGICNYTNITGNINIYDKKIGYLPQIMPYDILNLKVFDYLFEDYDEYYYKVNSLYKYLNLIGLDDYVIEQRISILSGGEKVKVSALKLLLGDYDILFLDEPTNDLDIETLEWLEKFINDTDKPIMYVSHDETLLSNTANMILHIEQIKNKTECRHTLERIDYNSYIKNRLYLIDKQTQIAKSQKRELNKKQDKLRKVVQKVEYQQNTITRADPHGAKLLKKKMHSLKSQKKRLENYNLTQIPDVEESIKLLFDNNNISNSKEIISLSIKELKINKKVLCKNLKLDVAGKDHICITGKNGCGKTTLIKQIYDAIKDRKDLNVGYMPQDYDEILEKYEYVLDFIAPNKNKCEITKARTYLGNMKFTNEEMLGKINDLSNGSKAKLFLAKLSLDNCNVLVLDEPTRNISPLSNPIIRKILKEYKGTIISVSHDRKYIDEVIDKIYILSIDGLKLKI